MIETSGRIVYLNQHDVKSDYDDSPFNLQLIDFKGKAQDAIIKSSIAIYVTEDRRNIPIKVSGTIGSDETIDQDYVSMMEEPNYALGYKQGKLDAINEIGDAFIHAAGQYAKSLTELRDKLKEQ